ncbi:ThuA domain-containing protein, partial [Georgenia sp. 10Sc9-8]|nr:ThuA domain-containing protein [Georgenia halotolerans]
ADDDYEVLVVGKTLGFRHSHIDDTTQAIIDLGEDHGFTVDVWDPPNDSTGPFWGASPGQPELTMESTPFTSAEDLSQYATIIFVSPVDGTNNQDPEAPRLLDDAELAAFQGYIRDGGGFVGIHAATDAMHAVPWWSELTGGGARFQSHPRQQEATMHVEDPTHPSTEMLPLVWERFDEWYNYTANPRADVHVLITLDEETYNPGSGAMGEDHPIAWCQNFDGGRSWYEGAGHTDESYSDPLFLEHILGGIEWTAGVVDGGGNCVTFDEVEELVDDLDTDTGRERAAVRNVTKHLDKAEQAADADNHAKAARELRTASVLAGALVRGEDGDVLSDKIADLAEWQRGLATSGR